MICLYCDHSIEPGEKIFWLGLEVPYINLKVHKDCWLVYKNTKFIQENSEKILRHIKNISEKPKKTKKNGT